MRDWVPEDHLIHFIMEAVGLLDLWPARVNHRGTGSDQYPPSMMLGLLIYCYATGTFSSRNEAAARVMAESQLAKIEQLHAAGELRERQRRYYSDRPMREPVEIGREDSSILVRDSG